LKKKKKQEGEFQKLLLQFQNDLKAQDEERRKLESQLDGAIKEKKNMEKRLTQVLFFFYSFLL